MTNLISLSCDLDAGNAHRRPIIDVLSMIIIGLIIDQWLTLDVGRLSFAATTAAAAAPQESTAAANTNDGQDQAQHDHETCDEGGQYHVHLVLIEGTAVGSDEHVLGTVARGIGSVAVGAAAEQDLALVIQRARVSKAISVVVLGVSQAALASPGHAHLVAVGTVVISATFGGKASLR